MRLLVIAYEFPPSPSPQSLRWAYLAREMAGRGHEVHVLAPDLSYGGLDSPFDLGGVSVHRAYPGPIKRFVSRRMANRRGSASSAGENSVGPMQPNAPDTRLNWKGKALAYYERAVSALVFPDHRAVWNFWARGQMRDLLTRVRPDAVISSHEPASTLRLGLSAQRDGWVWIADLGDPVLAPYTPPRWRRKAASLERQTCRRADAVVVTSEAARETMIQRHGVDESKLAVIPQGCPDRVPAGARKLSTEGPLDLVYTGAFYPFRPAEPLLAAVAACEGVRLHIASALPPEAALRAAEAAPEKVILYGQLSHRDALRLQDRADVLVNIGNRLPAQVPGKLYEYLSSGKPIVHLQATAQDSGAELVLRLKRGWVCGNRADEIEAFLARLASMKDSGALADGVDLSESAIEPYRWSTLAMRYMDVIGRARASRNV